MKNDFDYISDSSKKYMKAIEELSWKPIVYAADLADYVGVSESSVLTALDELKAEGQITIDPTGRISLTNAKRKVKAGVTKSDEVLMGIPEKKASFEEADTVLTSSGDEHYDNGLETEKTEDSTYTSKTDGVFFDTADKKADGFARFAGLFSVLSIEKDGAESESIKMTEYTAETEQDTESTNEQLGRNGNATEEEKEHEEITSAEIPASSGGYEEQIITDVLYKPGEEPEPIQRRLKILFEKLDSTYPDKIVTYLHRDHKKLGERVTDLYRKLGYPDGNTFLAAYGYTVKRGQSGAPKTVDASGIVEELRLRYKDGPTCSSMDELKAENPDLAPKFKTLQNKSKEYFGMPFSSYLLKEGIMKSKNKYAGGLGLLKERYADSPFEGKQFVLFSQNPDINWAEVKEAAEKAGMKLNGFLIKEKILAPTESIITKTGLKIVIGELKKRYPAGKEFTGSYDKLVLENSDLLIPGLYTFINEQFGISPQEYMIKQGIIKPEIVYYEPQIYNVEEIDVSGDEANDWECLDGDGGLYIKDYHGSKDHIIIPVSINSKKLNGIVSFAFQKCKAKTIEIPGCYGIVPKRMCYCNSSLKTIIVGEGISEIGEGAFFKVPTLENVYVSKSVEMVHDDHAFNATKWFDNQGENVIVGTVYIKYKGKGIVINIPHGVKTVGQFVALSNGKVSKVKIPSTVTTLCRYAFGGRNTENIQEFVYSDSIVNIGPNAFGEKNKWLDGLGAGPIEINGQLYK